MVWPRLIALEMVAESSAGIRATAASRPPKRRRCAARGRRARRSAGLRIVVAAVIPDDAMIAAVILSAVAMIAVVVMIVAMIAVVIVMVVVMAEEAQTPRIEPDESVVDVEVVVLGRSKAADAGIVRPVAPPFVAPPVAANPIIVVALPIAIIERSAIPLAREIDRAVGDRIIPEIVRATRAVAIAARVVGKPDAAAWPVAITVGARRHACE